MILIGIYLFSINLTKQNMLYDMAFFRHEFHVTQNEFLNLDVTDISINNKNTKQQTPK